MAPSVYDAIKFCSWELLKIYRYALYFTKRYKICSSMVLIENFYVLLCIDYLINHTRYLANTWIQDAVNNDFPNTKNGMIRRWFGRLPLNHLPANNVTLLLIAHSIFHSLFIGVDMRVIFQMETNAVVILTHITSSIQSLFSIVLSNQIT